MTGKEIFYKKMNPLIEQGLAREIYSNDTISICNLANASYVVFDFDIIKEDLCWGLSADQKSVPNYINNKNFFEAMVTRLPEETVVGMSVDIINPNIVQRLIELKEQTDKNGPMEKIDLDMEEKIMQKYGKKTAGLREPGEEGKKVCSNCGSMNPMGNSFCENCGHEVD